MKRILFAAAAVVAISGSALAAGTVNITGTIPQTCTLTGTDTLTLPGSGTATLTTGLVGPAALIVVNCNYDTSVSVGAKSTSLNGSVSNGTNSQTYQALWFGHGLTPLTSSFLYGAPAAVTANVPLPVGPSVQLDAAITIAGTYTDTITLDLAP